MPLLPARIANQHIGTAVRKALDDDHALKKPPIDDDLLLEFLILLVVDCA